MSHFFRVKNMQQIIDKELINRSLDFRLRQYALKMLEEYITPLKEIKVDYIGYREFYRDGTSMAFCTSPGWYEVSKDIKLMSEMATHYAHELLFVIRNKFHCIIRSASNANNTFLRKLLIHDMCNSLLFYIKSKKVIKMYSFISSVDNHSAPHFFMNERFKLELFINSHSEIMESILRKAEFQSLRTKLFSKDIADCIFSVDDSYCGFFTGNKTTSHNYDSLTQKESECVALLVNGATYKDIAHKMDISIRTAEFHVSNIRKKLNMKNKFDISNKVKEDFNLSLI